MKLEGSWISLCSTGQAEDGHLLMLTMGEAQVFGPFLSRLIYPIKNSTFFVLPDLMHLLFNVECTSSYLEAP